MAVKVLHFDWLEMLPSVLTGVDFEALQVQAQRFQVEGLKVIDMSG